jgi:Leucine-rich repeat (LRR) protein
MYHYDWENVQYNCDYTGRSPPPEILDSVTELLCRHNKLIILENLPRKVRKLNCNDNELIELPELPESLIELVCSYNKLTELPSLPKTLVSIECYDNNLTRLPELPTSLVVLICYKNNLTYLPKLPDSLRTLWCAENNFMTSDLIPFGEFPSLFEICCNHVHAPTPIADINEKIENRKQCDKCNTLSLSLQSAIILTETRFGTFPIENKLCFRCLSKIH